MKKEIIYLVILNLLGIAKMKSFNPSQSKRFHYGGNLWKVIQRNKKNVNKF